MLAEHPTRALSCRPRPGPLTPFSTWQIDLLIKPSDAAIARLSATEVARAGQYHAAADRIRYLAAHVALRRLLKRHCGITTRREIYAQDVFGKWRLAGDTPWHFSLSYAGVIGIIGISHGYPIGVDIEVERQLDDVQALAKLYLDDRELVAFGAMDQADQNAAFLYGWTRKEACLKAIGTGLHIAPAQIHTGLRGVCQVNIGTTTVDIGSFRLDGIVGAWAQAH